MRRYFCWLVIVALLEGCSRPPVASPDACRTSSDAVALHPRRVDLLVVVTVAWTSTTYIQDKIAYWFGLFSERLMSNKTIDVQLGVVSSKIDTTQICAEEKNKVAHDGTLLLPREKDWPSQFPWPPAQPYLTYDMLREIYPEYADQFLVDVHTTATRDEGECSVTQFLESATRAVDGRNPGFVRPDSLLMILILTDREDCSTQDAALWEKSLWFGKYREPDAMCYEPPPRLLYPVDRYVSILKGLHRDGRTLVAILAADAAPTWKDYGAQGKGVEGHCSNTVYPSQRLPSFVAQVNCLGDPNLQAQIVDTCAVLKDKAATADQLAKTVFQITGE
jgi:hypothetical protein